MAEADPLAGFYDDKVLARIDMRAPQIPLTVLLETVVSMRTLTVMTGATVASHQVSANDTESP